MITNLLAAITFVTVTNTATILPKVWRATGCPDNLPGCLVAHGELVVDPTAKTRTVITECVEQKCIAVAEQLLVQTNKLLWRKTEEQRLRVQETWVTELTTLEESNKVVIGDNRQTATNVTLIPETNYTVVGTFLGWHTTNTIIFK